METNFNYLVTYIFKACKNRLSYIVGSQIFKNLLFTTILWKNAALYSRVKLPSPFNMWTFKSVLKKYLSQNPLDTMFQLLFKSHIIDCSHWLFNYCWTKTVLNLLRLKGLKWKQNSKPKNSFTFLLFVIKLKLPGIKRCVSHGGS